MRLTIVVKHADLKFIWLYFSNLVCWNHLQATMMDLQYYEITTDDFKDLMKNAVRLNKNLLFFCRQEHLFLKSWITD